MRSGLLRSAATLGLLVMLVFVVEATARLEDWVQYRSPVLTRVKSAAELITRTAEGMHGRPNVRFQKWKMNALGYRGPEISPTIPAGTVRVITVGASETFGLFESENKEYPRQLEDSLNASEDAACYGHAFQVVNAGLPGMSLPSLDGLLRRRLRRLNARVIVIYPTPGFYLNEHRPSEARPDSTGRLAQLPSRNLLHLRTADRVREQVKQLLPGPVKRALREREVQRLVANRPPGWVFDRLPPQRLRAYEVDLRKVIGTVRHVGSIPVLATHLNPSMGSTGVDEELLSAWRRMIPRATEQTMVAFDSAARIVTLRVAQDSGVFVADLVPERKGNWDGVFRDFVHFSDAGSALMAEALATKIQEALTAASKC